MIPLAQMKSIWGTVTRAAGTRSGHLPHDSLHELLQLPASFVSDQNTWTIFLHVPLVKNKFRLLKAEPAIFATNKGTIRMVLPIADFIITNEDDSLHREETRASLDAKCTRWINTLWCYNLGPFRRIPGTTCLGSMLTNQPKHMASNCPIYDFNSTSAAYAVSSSSVLLYSRGGSSADMLCDDGTRTSTTFKGIAIIDIPPRCALSTSEYYMRRSGEVNTKMSIDLDIAWPKLKEVKDFATPPMTEPGVSNTISVPPINPSLDVPVWSTLPSVPHWASWVGFVIAAAATLLVTCLACIVCCWCQRRSRPPPPTPMWTLAPPAPAPAPTPAAAALAAL
jgi:hypothetical protein